MSITICIILFLCLIALAILFKPVFISKKNLKLLLSDRKYLNTFSKKDLEVRNVDSVYNYINTNISMSVTNASFYDVLKLSLLTAYIDLRIFIAKKQNAYFDYSKFNKIPWKFGIIKGKLYENGLPHTRKDVIILPKRSIKRNTKSLIELLIHEKTHIFQKIYPEYAQNYIKQNNFVKSGLNKGIVRANPDIDDYIYADSSGNELKAVYRNNAKSIRDVIISDQYYEHPFERMAIDFERIAY